MYLLAFATGISRRRRTFYRREGKAGRVPGDELASLNLPLAGTTDHIQKMPSPGSIRLSKCVLLAALIGACSDGSGVVTPKPLPRLNHDPILFVHGLRGSSASFAQMRARFVAAGWQDGVELWAFTYGSTVTNAAVGQEIHNQVNHIMTVTGASKVDIISHHVGSLSSRFYLRNFGGTRKVDAWISLGGPNHGSTVVNQCTLIPCQEMAPKSAFMTALNAEVEAQPPVRYATWRSPCDELVMPHSSVSIHDAENYLTACMPSGALITDAAVYEQVKTFVR